MKKITTSLFSALLLIVFFSVAQKASAVAPTVALSAETNEDSISTTLNGTVNPNSLATSAWYYWGKSNVACSSLPNSTTSQSMGSGSSNVALTAELSGFLPSATYYYCAVAVNSDGISYGSVASFVQESASGCQSVSSSGDYTVSSSCVFGNGTNDGIDKGTGTQNDGILTLEKGTTLTVGIGQTVGYGIIYKPGATVVRLSGGSLRRGAIWVPDADGDGYPDNIETEGQIVQSTQPSGYLRRASVVNMAQDCDSTSATKFKNYIAFADADGDGYANSASQSLLCSGNTLTGGSLTSLGVDCDDSNIHAYINQNVATDADQDGRSTSAATSQCMGASTTVSGRTYYKNTASTYSFIASTSIIGTSDCNDSNANIYQNVSVATDADLDGYSTSAATTQCVGASSTISGRTYYVSSTGAVNRIASGSIISQPDCQDNPAGTPCPPATTSATNPSSTSQNNVSWSGLQTGGAVPAGTGFDILWCSGSSCTPSTVISNVTSPYAHTGRNSSTTYGYVIRAKNAAGNGAVSSPVRYATTATPYSQPYYQAYYEGYYQGSYQSYYEAYYQGGYCADTVSCGTYGHCVLCFNGCGDLVWAECYN